MSHRIEDYTAQVTTYEYRVFDQPYKGFEYESTPEQICLMLWKKHPSAHIVKMTTFGINHRKHIDRVELKKINNPYAEGMEEGTGRKVYTVKEIEEFKSKNNIE